MRSLTTNAVICRKFHFLEFCPGTTARLSRKVSDEFTVPSGRGHHRELHRHGDEAAPLAGSINLNVADVPKGDIITTFNGYSLCFEPNFASQRGSYAQR